MYLNEHILCNYFAYNYGLKVFENAVCVKYKKANRLNHPTNCPQQIEIS